MEFLKRGPVDAGPFLCMACCVVFFEYLFFSDDFDYLMLEFQKIYGELFMKKLMTILAICFSVSAMANISSFRLDYSLDDISALEYGFPHEVIIEKILVRQELFGESTVRIVGIANDQHFNLIRKLKKIRVSEDNQFEVKASLWEDSIGGETCDEEIVKEISLRFKVSKKSLMTSEHSLRAVYLFTPDNCHAPSSIKEYYYSLMKLKSY